MTLNIQRRYALKAIAGLLISLNFGLKTFADSPDDEDHKIFNSLTDFARHNNLHRLPYGELIIVVAKTFLRTPYNGGTLDSSEDERLIVNLRAFDCFTFLETVLALSLCIKSRNDSFDCFSTELRKIRYRNGKIDGYASRLHYFTEWLLEGEEKHYLNILYGPRREKKELNFLSKNTTRKDQLKLLEDTEVQLSKRSLNYFSCADLALEEAKTLFRTGDIVGFKSNVEGLDFNHVGFLCKKNSEWSFIHASSVNGKVEIYDGKLEDYCSSVKKNSGVVLARPLWHY